MSGFSGGRKNFGPRSVACSVCGKRGTTNLKLIGKEPIICAECKRKIGLEEEG